MWNQRRASPPAKQHSCQPSQFAVTQLLFTCGTTRPRAVEPGAWAILVLVVLGYLASASRSLHADRLPHRQAGVWLARQAPGTAAVLDTRGWTALYSAQPTYQYDEAKTALCDRRLGYVVVQPRELRHNSARARTLRYLLETAGECVVRFGAQAATSTDEAAVTVYRWHAERFRLPSIRSMEEHPSRATGVATRGVATGKSPNPRRVGSMRFVQAISAQEKKVCR